MKIYEVQGGYKSNKIFFAKSKLCPAGWSFDHVGFISGNKQVQKSGHRHAEGIYITNKITDDDYFPPQKIFTIDIGKNIELDMSDNKNLENCGMYVAHNLKQNGIDMTVDDIYKIFRVGNNQ